MPSQGAGPPALGDCQSARGAAGGGCVSAGLAWGRCGASESTASTPPGEGTASALRTPLSSCACEGSASAPRTPRSAGPPTAGSLQYPSLQGPSLEHCGFPEVLRGPAAPWPTWGLGRCPRRRWCGFLSKGAGVANIVQSRRSSACDALESATTAVVSLIYKLQVRSPELIDEFFSLAEQLVDNTRRFVAADVVLQRVLSSGFTSSDEQRREQIVNAIEAEMEKTFSVRETTKSLMREVGHRGLPPSSEASATTGGAAQPADSERRLLPRPPTTPPPRHLFDNSTISQ